MTPAVPLKTASAAAVLPHVAPETAPPVLVTLVIPAFNEEAILEQSLAEIAAETTELASRFQFEGLIVNDGSKDRTGEVAETLAQRYTWLRVIHHAGNRGLSEALRTGFANSKGRYVIVLDADMSYGADHIRLLLDRIVQGSAQVVVASPYMKGGRITSIPPFRYALSRIANRFLAALSRSRLSTLTSMVRAYDGDFIRALVLRGMAMAAMPEIIYKAMVLRARLDEVPAHLDWSRLVAHRGSRQSSLRLKSHIVSTIMSGFAFRPFIFFILPGLMLALFSSYVIFWMFMHVFEQLRLLPPQAAGDVERALRQAYAAYPYTYIVGLLSTMVSIQLLALGILALQAKRYFEEMFTVGSALSRRLATIEERLPR